MRTLVGHEVAEQNAAMRADLAVGQAARLQFLDQERAGNAEQVGGLLGGEFGVDGDQGHGMSFRHGGEQLDQQAHGRGGKHHGTVEARHLDGKVSFQKACQLTNRVGGEADLRFGGLDGIGLREGMGDCD